MNSALNTSDASQATENNYNKNQQALIDVLLNKARANSNTNNNTVNNNQNDSSSTAMVQNPGLSD
ncbi:hypothetical protein [Coxiella-like endosymbiont of Rhipicephalus sanguineus]|uniref:hypothetical protein n=1 Tax=Coxiella-like endosymbiont of Rhipicephalus sanguineus TaxID=1955402 RepID=UPI00203CFED0|nr:hypothetical protein [Coxiella-like endosymbiont of Rhipicephalus sanguineus]